MEVDAAGSSTAGLIAFIVMLLVGGAIVDRKSLQTILAALKPLERVPSGAAKCMGRDLRVFAR